MYVQSLIIPIRMLCRYYAAVRSSAYHTSNWRLLFATCVDSHGIGETWRATSIFANQSTTFGFGHSYSVFLSTFYRFVVPRIQEVCSQVTEIC